VVEEVIHAARSYISSASQYHAIVKVGFQNAFNTVCRDCLFESVAAAAAAQVLGSRSTGAGPGG